MYNAQSTYDLAKKISSLGDEINSLVKTKCKKPGNRVLVCDGDASSREAVASVIKSADYKVVTAGSGEDLRNILKANDIGLLVTNFNLPDLDGEEIIEIMKNHHVPMIAVTSLSDDSSEVVSAKLGGFSVVTNPMSRRSILNSVMVHFGPPKGLKSQSQCQQGAQN